MSNRSDGATPAPPTSALPWSDLTVLVTGGTGSFGRRFVDIVSREYRPRRLVVFSRDELKQHEMRQRWPDAPGSPMRYFIGDVRDLDRLRRAMIGVDIVVHAAALKQVPTCEYNPMEAVLTNVMGTRNVIEAALDRDVGRVMALSTDKAVNPVNLYGATKLVAEKLVVQGNAYRGHGNTRLSCVRYGNVIGSRGSVVPLFRQQRASGRVTVTDPRMTRFWITLEQGVRFVLAAIERMQGGEVFVPKLPSSGLEEVAAAVAPECRVECIGIRAGEKLHELLISEDEGRHSVEYGDMYVVKPPSPWYFGDLWGDGAPLPEGFAYGSGANGDRLALDDLRHLIERAHGEDGS